MQKPVYQLLADIPNIHLLPSLDYFPFLHLMRHSCVILTDLVMRDTTERPEAVEAGTVRLVGTDAGTIVKNIETLLEDETAYWTMSRSHKPLRRRQGL